jgi:hypothetical protein
MNGFYSIILNMTGFTGLSGYLIFAKKIVITLSLYLATSPEVIGYSLFHPKQRIKNPINPVDPV